MPHPRNKHSSSSLRSLLHCDRLLFLYVVHENDNHLLYLFDNRSQEPSDFLQVHWCNSKSCESSIRSTWQKQCICRASTDKVFTCNQLTGPVVEALTLKREVWDFIEDHLIPNKLLHHLCTQRILTPLVLNLNVTLF